jgi:hypothetical protein
MPTSRSAKEICREDPDSISCKVATKREARRKRYKEKYGDDKPEAKTPEKDVETEAPKPATERRKYLDEQERKAGI